MSQTLQIDALSGGVNQKGLRDHNERLILSLLQREGAMPGSDIAKHTHLSAQTVSVILRKLEADGLVEKGNPVKGKVGKPSIPMGIRPDGAVSVGFKLGRRNSEMSMTDLCGNVLFERHMQYEIALPSTVFSFVRKSFEEAVASIGPSLSQRLCGIGIAAPFEIWKWGATDGNTPEEFLSWKDVSFESKVAEFTKLPVFMVNDATSACWAEHVYGRGKEFNDYAYIFISTFIGGGVVLNGSVYEGVRGNAGAFGPLRVGDRHGTTRQLLNVASIHVLETMLSEAGHDPRALWKQPQDWSDFEPEVDEWIDDTARAISQACISACAVIDFEAFVIDGFMPEEARARLVEKIRVYLLREDSRGLILPRIEEGHMGGRARAIGAACTPMFAQYFLGRHNAVF